MQTFTLTSFRIYLVVINLQVIITTSSRKYPYQRWGIAYSFIGRQACRQLNCKVVIVGCRTSKHLYR